MFPLPCTHFLCTCGLFRSYSLGIMLCLAWTAWGIVLPDLGAAWMQTACSWATRPSGRSSVSRRPCVGSEADLHSLSHCCSQKGSSSCFPHCYERRQQCYRHPINEPGIILRQRSFSCFYKCRHAHIVQYKQAHTVRLTLSTQNWHRKPYKSFLSTYQTLWADEKWSRWIYWTYCWITCTSNWPSSHVNKAGSVADHN